MIGSILTFLVVLSILVLVHELGHFLMARRAGVMVEEFGFGLPPRIFGKKRGETLYSINLLPFGGFVKLHGEDTEKQITKPERAFLNKSKKSRTLIIIAGVLMNFILAILAFSIVYSFTGVPRESENVRVVGVREGSPASEIGLKEGDIIREVGGQKVSKNSDFIGSVEKVKGEEVVLRIERGGEGVIDLNVVPRTNPPEGEGALGVIISATETYYPPLLLRPAYGIYFGFKEAFFWAGVVAGGMAKMISNLFAGTLPKDVAGPVGIYALTTEAAKFGVLTLVNFIGVLSVNLAILNVLPFPALDGGRLLFIVIEGVFGRRVVPRVESLVHTIGLIILLILILAVTAHDIQKLISLGGVTGYIESILK